MIKDFMDKNFLLHSEAAEYFYHNHAAKMPIIDFHSHLNPAEIAEDKQFDNLTQIWLYADHYKWRAMRTNGIDEYYCTGEASDYEKFEKWAETVPYTMRNPLYHWTHLELQRYFGINDLLTPDTAKKIYNTTSEMLKTKDFSVRNLLRKMNIEVICTTDDPIDNLKMHQQIKNDNFEIKVLPTWRPDSAMNISNPNTYNQYLDSLSNVSNIDISTFDKLIEALRKRHEYFAQNGCKSSDHGVETLYSVDYNYYEIEKIFSRLRARKEITTEEILKFKSAMCYEFGLMDNERGWVQQWHIGVFRNNNTRLFNQLGADKGFDSIGDFNIGASLVRFLDNLDKNNKLTKTILYNINPSDNALIATMIGNFQDGTLAGKIQMGAAWWFLDQKEGIESQLNAVSNYSLLSRFVGMLTDSRSFLSYPRHEYFRRILCNTIGNDIEKGELPYDKNSIGKMIENISYGNAKEFFGF